MSDTTITASWPSARPLGSRSWFLATIFTSAFLLFLVQPMIARMALPRVGGAPAVWNSAMLVYQALLLGGYAYADALGRFSPKAQGRLHIALLVAAAVTLPIGLLDWAPPVGGNIFLWVPWLFLVSIGPLFFVVSAHAPLLQRWYAARGHGDPYPLYAASNFGSFLGLVSYPLLVEPLVDVDLQSRGWSAAYLALILLVGGCTWRLPAAGQRRAEAASPAPSWRTMARWALIAAVPSGLIMSTTLHLTTDIVAMPLLWVLPLGLYLLSFSVAFATRRKGAALATRLAPLALLLSASGVAADRVPFPWVMLAAELTGFFLIAVALHARLFEERPAPDRLTRFYLVMSTGGALGGLFCALVAPLLFDWTYEHPLLLLAAALLLPMANPFERMAALWRSPRGKAATVAVALLLVALVLVPRLAGEDHRLAALAMTLAALCGVAAIGNRPLFLAAACATMLIGGGLDKLALSAEPGRMSRSFFGVYSVREGAHHDRWLVHGTTVHGIQNLGSPARERMPTSYYTSESGVGRAMAWKASRPGARVSVVGLGAGTLACYARPGERWRYYEIDPEIVAVARDSGRFLFLPRCAPKMPIVVGDARLTLERAPPASSDLLVIDAFSSDSIPIHLLTREAFALYRQRLAPGGLLMVHISNRYLDLEPLLAAQARAGGWSAAIRRHQPSAAQVADGANGSFWVALAPAPRTIEDLAGTGKPGDWQPLRKRPGLTPWTDGRSTILPLIRW